MNLARHISEQASVVNVNPTEAQKLAGNYQKGHIKVHGLDITIENPKGSTRSGTAPGGKKWKSKLPNHYGYLRKTEGADGDHVDVFLGPHLKSPHVFAIDQHRLHDRGFDEHKIMLGFGNKAHAVAAYSKAFSDGKGADRVGHVQHMSIDGFKDWLRDGDTKSAIKRAAGGRIGYADGGAPPYEPSEAPPYEPPEPDAGKLDAMVHGAKQGLTYGFGDELTGARAAAPKIPFTDKNLPEMVGPVPVRTLAGVARTGLGYATGADPEGIKTYEDARDAERRASKAAKVNHPFIHAGAEMAGAIPAMAAMPELGAARAIGPAAGRMAKFGAGVLDAAAAGGEYGAASGAGEGENIGERAMNAASGLVSGIVGGGIAHGVGTGIGAAAEKYGAPVVNTVKGWFNTNGEAARRVAGGLRPDQEMIQAGTAQGMTPQQWAAARARGEPVTLADLGAGNTQSLLRSSANTSPEGRAMLENKFGDNSDRFKGQSERVAGDVRNAIPGGTANARKTGDQLVAEYDAGRVPAYKAAYQAGDKPLMSPAMERMMGSDTFVNAMKKAISSGKDRDVAMGLGGFNPMVNVTADGRIVFNKGAQGVPTYPNLQYWDQVKRELDSVANQAKRSGDTASVAGDLSRILRTELDQQVPQYSKARGVAEQYFGESNALEAGRKLAGKKVPAEDVQKILRQMKPDERALFKEGYASDLAERVLGNMKDTVNVTKGQGIFQSPNERKMAATIFGPGGMAQLQARMHLERIMDGARQAMGNSTTARQLIEAGLAGGALSGYASGWDPNEMLKYGVAAAGARGGVGKFAPQIAQGAKNLIGKVDAKTARRVAELLTSDDPRLLQEGYKMAAQSQAIMSGLKSIANRVALAGQTSARGPVTEGVRALAPYRGPNLGDLQGTVPANADDKQQQP